MLSNPRSRGNLRSLFSACIRKTDRKNNNWSLIEFSRSPKEQIMPLDKGLATIQQIYLWRNYFSPRTGRPQAAPALQRGMHATSSASARLFALGNFLLTAVPSRSQRGREAPAFFCGVNLRKIWGHTIAWGTLYPIYLDIVTMTYIKGLRVFREVIHFSLFTLVFIEENCCLPTLDLYSQEVWRNPKDGDYFP